MGKVKLVLGEWYEGEHMLASEAQLCVRVVLPPGPGKEVQGVIEIGYAMECHESIQEVQDFIDKWRHYAERNGFEFEIDPKIDTIEVDQEWKVTWCKWLAIDNQEVRHG